MSNFKVSVVIPFYKPTLSAFEQIALEQAKKVLSDYSIIAIKPQSLILPDEVKLFPFTDIISFEDAYFKDIQGYNALMLADTFYKQFLAYEYILIYQLDAFVFKDDLNYWCSKGFDYIGAPWITRYKYNDFVKTLKSKIQRWAHTRFNVQKDGLPSPMQFERKVGNGGFSLRRVRKFYELSISMREQKEIYLTRNGHQFNEDVFWGIEVNRKRKHLRIPYYKTAMKFSVELFPEKSLAVNKGKLPFGCHAWDKHLDFWRPFFKQQGYEI